MRLPNFIKDVATLAGGKALAFTISMLTMPVISRLFRPEVYGVSALYVSILAVLTTIGTSSFPQAIILPKKEKVAAELFLLSMLSLMLWATTLWLALAVVWFQLGNPYPAMGIWLWCLPVAAILLGLLQASENWLTRTRRFKVSAAGDFSQTALTSGSRIACGFYYGSNMLLWFR